MPPSRSTPPSAYQLSDDAIEAALVSGDLAGVLEIHFGEEKYRELVELARRGGGRSLARGGPRVWILPGIMGSRIGVPDEGPVVWLDPLRVSAGALTDLALDGGPSAYGAVGVLPLVYFELKLRLRLEGYEVAFFPFDWRQGVDRTGAELYEALADERETYLVAHSMGGLVARAALSLDRRRKRIRRLVMLGTPNHGSFAAIQALRGTYALVRRVAALDLRHSADDLVRGVFHTFPGLHQLLPSPAMLGPLDLYRASSWPAGLVPRQEMLDTVSAARDRLAPGDDRMILVAGVDQTTTVGVEIANGELSYTESPEGDGTVPLACAQLEGIAQSYYVEESHGLLPSNLRVTSAVIDLVAGDRTTQLPTTWTKARRGSRRVAEKDIAHAVPTRAAALSLSEERRLLREVAAPAEAAVAARVDGAPATDRAQAGFEHRLDQLVIGRRSQRRLDVQLAFGDLTAVDAKAYALGLFERVTPSGAAAAVDSRLGGAVAELALRRMFSAGVGEIFMLPVGRNALPADAVLFAGLGPFDRFDDEVQRVAAENAVRAFVRSRIDDFAMVLFGAGSGQPVADTLRAVLEGLLRGLRDADRAQRFRSVTLCERDRSRYAAMKAELYRLASTSLFADVEVTFEEVSIPEPVAAPAPPRGLARREEAVYLLVREEAPRGGRTPYSCSLLGVGSKAAVLTTTAEPLTATVDDELAKLPRAGRTELDGIGQRLAKAVVGAPVAAALATLAEHPLVVVHDAGASRIPWEAVAFGEHRPALAAGLSRQHVGDDLPVARWLEQRQLDDTLEVLVVGNPTLDLDGAERETARVTELFRQRRGVRVELLSGREATKRAVLAALRSGRFDVIHYAGHAFFDPVERGRSGILCHGREVLAASDLLRVAHLPSLAFFNACEAGRVRGRAGAARRPAHRQAERKNIGLAEAFLRGGIANYVGTYWPVGDEAAGAFAARFYDALLGGQTLGAAIRAGRRAVHDIGSIDWADYVHFGTADFALKLRADVAPVAAGEAREAEARTSSRRGPRSRRAR